MKVSKLKIYPFIFILFYCNVTSAQVSEHIKTTSFEGYIYSQEHLVAGTFPISNGYDLNILEVTEAGRILNNHILDIKNRCSNVQINKCSLKKYYRQYWGTIDDHNHIIVNILLIKKSLIKTLNLNLEEDIINILDGGCEVIHVMVNIEEETIIVEPNGIS